MSEEAVQEDQIEDPLENNTPEEQPEENTSEEAAQPTEEQDNETDPHFIPPNTIMLPADIDLVKFVQDVYELSEPQGLGKMHYIPGPLPESEAVQLVKRYENNDGMALSLDYVNGRACKMNVWRNEAGDLYIRDKWFDHTKAEFHRLLQRTKVKGVKIERDKEMEEQIKEAREANPFATEAGENE